jgi:hypothetical protein
MQRPNPCKFGRGEGGPQLTDALSAGTAMSIKWNDSEKATIIAYAGDKGDVVRVTEGPEDILKGRN